ncbi:MAG: hypothetical protein U1E54_04955, partial [Candidatus Levybacteria bacterium]|nr:hypothetical protein [Candidatus Levybacteria bacterium]
MDKKIVFVFAILILGVFFVEDVNAQIFSGGKGTANYVNYGSSFERYYGSNLKTYWPVLANKESCEARQDILIQVSPAGCQPAVVRSDLLAEQNVPVFCQLDALQLNPTIDVKQIRNIRFSGDYPPEIAGIGFHPARAALRTGDRLLGSPLESNIGYVVVVLKRNPNEAEMPEFLEFSVNAQIDYYSGNALGIGRTEFLLQETTEDEWKLQSNKQSFFNGDYSVRLLDTDKEFIDVAIYLGDKRISTTRVERRGSNPEVYLPGHYCQTALDLDYVELISPEDIARIQVGDDVIDVYAGSSFLNNKCSVRKIDSDVLGGKVEIVCGNEKAILTTKIRILQVGTEINYFEGRDDLGLWEITAVNENGRYDLEEVKGDGKRAGIVLDSFRPASGEEFVMDKAYPTSDVYFYSSIGNYSFTADSYGNEKKNEGVQKTIGEEALERAINLALSAGKDASVARLIEEYLRLYPNGNRAGYFNQRLNDLYYRDSSLAGTVVNIDNEFKVIKLLDVKKPEKKSSAKIVWGAQTEEIFTGGTKEFGGRKVTLINVKSEDEVDVEVSCFNEAQNKEEKNKKRTLRLGEAGEIACGDGILKVNDVNFEEYVKLRINPVTRTGGLTNFSVGVGIEKRAIELTPEKAKKKISNLDESIKEWESISNTLGNVVTGLKGACFATAGVLTVKNFFTGLSGEALARQQVMRGDDGWTKKCEQMLSTNGGQYSSLGACYNANADEIKRDVNARAKAIKETNVLLEGIEDRATISEGGIFGGDNFDDEKAKKELLDEINREFGDVKLDNNRVGVNNLGKLLEGVDAKSLTYSQLRDIYTNSLIINGVGDGGSTKVGKEKAEAELNTMAVSIKESLDFAERAKSSGVSAFIIGNRNVGNYFGGTVASYRGKGYDLSSLNGKVNDNTKVQLVQGKREYIVVLDEGGKNVDGVYVVNNKVVEVTDISNGSGLSGSQEEELGNIPRTYNLVTSNSYSNTFAPGEAKVRYFEREPYKGMPAVVPFDLNNGFYVATKQTLPLLGNTASYESNGRPASFWVCNVMQDLKIGFASSNFGDDQCVQFNFYTGQSFSNFPALSESETKTLVGQAVKALQEAAEQYKAGVKQVRILGQTMQVGNSMAIIPGTQCQDYMSPGDCNLLFNVCDPVICPSSRCDFGGAYPVDDVIQSGIVGSVLLCLPNFKENIYVPVCLTGIKAGIDGYLSILKSHKACLEENIESGSYVGICDQITSVYTCEFFWRQAAPLAKFALPKVIEGLSGEGSSRGGGEYLTVASSWQNAEDSIDYFTQSYAVNSIEAFRARSFDEAGTDICRAFVSAKGPNAFETLIEPDSPSQFHAWYSEIPFTDATVPATSQYKVFYHIYSGNDRGVSFSVYLKDPPENVQYHSTDRVVVANGFAPRGEFATETSDFTAPKGYKQLCVRINDKEECGFKQVSSSFAINYVKDVIVKDELLQTGISSESECISGSVNPAALLNPNLQEAVQEAINPEIYRRGIVRVCATANPGIGTDASR